MGPFNRNHRYGSSFSIQARQYHCSCSSSTYFNPLEQAVLPCSFPTSRKSSEQTGIRTQAKMPPMTLSAEGLESFRWTLLGMYLCIVGGLCLLIAVHVHIHRPLPHERQWGSKAKHIVFFVPSAFPIVGCVDKALPRWYCDCLDVRFASLTMNKSRRVCSNYKFLGEILNMH
jgi:hypothetical protein